MTQPTTSKPAKILCLALLALCSTGPLRSQAEKPGQAAPNQDKTGSTVNAAPPAEKPADSTKPGDAGKPPKPEPPQPPAPTTSQPDVTASCLPDQECHLGSALTLRFPQANTDITTDNAQSLELMLNGHVMKNLTARKPLQLENSKGVLIYDLKVQSANKDDWKTVLAAGQNQTLSVKLSRSGTPIKGVDASVYLQALPSWAWLVFLMMAALLIGFIVLAVKSDILRDGPALPNGTKLSFSLGKTQMAWWTFIIACSFLYIWMVTWDWNFLPPSALVLMGISATTALGAQLVDGNRNDRRQTLLDQQRGLANRLDQINVALRAAPSNAADLQTERTQKQAQLDTVNSALAQLPPDFGPSENFLTDILQDDTGVSLHRFQLAVWTLILGIVFIVQVLRSISIPEFNDTLLALMGISAGTYVGFKIPDPPKQS